MAIEHDRKQSPEPTRLRRVSPPARSSGSERFGFGVVVVLAFGMALAVGIPAHRDMEMRSRFQATLEQSRPHRTAASLACLDRALEAGTTAEELGLGTPSDYSSEYVTEVALEVPDDDRVLVTLRYRAFESTVPEGSTVIMTGTCRSDEMAWKISGSFPEKWRPKW